jgi:hypothetical protein
VSRLARRTAPLAVILAAATFAKADEPPTPPWKAEPRRADAVRVLVVTGGHDHDPDFYAVFDDAGFRTTVDPHPNAFHGDIRRRADVLVMYDMIARLEPAQQRNLRDFVEAGRGVVVLHHAICTAKDWPWWYEEVVGARWCFAPPDAAAPLPYKHDEDIRVWPTMDHPITRGVPAFRIWDETYKGLWLGPRIQVLLRTDHPDSDGPVAWIGPHRKARVVYLQLGHDRNATLNPSWQRLVRNAIVWSAGRLE